MSIWHFVSWVISIPIFPMNIRILMYRCLGMKLHSSARLAHSIFIGSNKLVMKEHTFVNVGCFLDGSNYIYIGEYVRLGPHVKILTGSHYYSMSTIRRGSDSIAFSKPVTLEKGAWIGMGVIIMPGVIIKEGCIIGAGSVVLKSTEPNGLYAGNPAKRIKNLPTN